MSCCGGGFDQPLIGPFIGAERSTNVKHLTIGAVTPDEGNDNLTVVHYGVLDAATGEVTDVKTISMDRVRGEKFAKALREMNLTPEEKAAEPPVPRPVSEGRPGRLPVTAEAGSA